VEKNKYETFESWVECIIGELLSPEYVVLLKQYLLDLWNSITANGFYPLRRFIWNQCSHTRHFHYIPYDYVYPVWITHWNIVAKETLIPYGYKPKDECFYIVKKNKYETFESWAECVINESLLHRDSWGNRKTQEEKFINSEDVVMFRLYLLDVWNSITVNGFYPLRRLVWNRYSHTRHFHYIPCHVHCIPYDYIYPVWITYWNTDFVIEKEKATSLYYINTNYVFAASKGPHRIDLSVYSYWVVSMGHSYHINLHDEYSKEYSAKDISPYYAPPASFIQRVRVYACLAVKHHPSKNKLPREICQLIAEYVI
jgi:hypothetical protein